MAKRKAIEAAGDESIRNHDDASEQLNIELPYVASPSISPATTEAASQRATEKPTEVSSATDADTISMPAGSALENAFVAKPESQPAKRPLFSFRPRHRRQALLAASIAIAAAVGAVVGAAASGAFSKPAMIELAVEENKATQQSVAHLAKEITNLKASLDVANKSANSQIAKISERLNRESAGITNSISPPQTVAPAPQASAAVPAPTPPVAAASHSSRPPIVANWSIRETRGGYIYVQGHGDVYQVVPGAPLPGLGPVEKIKRQDGRWLVVTPKGIIVSMRDRRYFEQF
jgi:hypothetical protein